MPKSTTFDRETVIAQVTELFWKKGFHATSMQDLVDATGLNRSSIYNTFGDKHQLFEESLKQYAIWQSYLTSKSLDNANSPLESIRHLFNAILINIKNDPHNKGCFFSNCTTELGNSDSGVQHLLIANKDAFVQLFENKLIQAKETGEIEPSKNPHALALYLYSSLHGLRVTAILSTDPKELDALVSQILDNL